MRATAHFAAALAMRWGETDRTIDLSPLKLTRPTRPRMIRQLAHRLIMLRRNHAAWLLLAARNGPLILASLKTLIEAHPSGIDFENAVEQLADVLADYANDSEFSAGEDPSLTARRELKQWVKRGLIVERNGQLLATDSLQRAFLFLDSLEDRSMTSTASRLATVQRAIEELDAQLSRSQSRREEMLRARIDALEDELAAVQAGEFKAIDGPQAEEGIREVYQLAISLLADFRRVEDSYREADRDLRHRIISERQNRGEIVEGLLRGHEALVKTVEGQVFESFYAQLVKTAELEEMKSRLRSILDNYNTEKALQRKQKADLRLLVSRLVGESQRVIQARARSERDVRGFLKSGLADEQVRVGALLQDIFHVALQVDWQSQKVRRTPGPLPPIAVGTPYLPLVERFRFKQIGEETADDLDLTVNEANPAEMDEEFWQAYRALDRAQLFESTLAQLKEEGESLTIGALARALPPAHDLETLAYWLAMARQAGIEIDDQRETIDLSEQSQETAEAQDKEITRFHVPRVEIDYAKVAHLDAGSLE